MSGVDPQPSESFALRQGQEAISLHATGFRHPAWLGRSGFTPYADVTHVILGQRGMRIATREACLTLRRSDFVEPAGPAALSAGLVRHIAGRPGGAEQLARMAALDHRLGSPAPMLLSRSLTALCVLVYILQLLVPKLEAEGIFSAQLVWTGELWRLVTANFLHGGPIHLALNGMCLLVLGGFLERIAGIRAAAFVMAGAGVGAMLGSLVAGYPAAVGASGIVAGIVAALLWMEFRRPEVIPAAWRLPRRLLLAAALLEFAVQLLVPGIAHAAHLGGAVAGLATIPWVAPGLSLQPVDRPWLRLANGVSAVGLAVALGFLTWAVVTPGAVERRVARLLEMPAVAPQVLNNQAWLIAISDDPDPDLLGVALAMAERAVDETEREDPNVLDTLAEVLFASGNRSAALDVIDEAIGLAPDEDYFREQRRRFAGERESGDRPDPPEAEPRLEPPKEEPPGLRI
jgi:membrane associated rhomboid family serine protease